MGHQLLRGSIPLMLVLWATLLLGACGKQVGPAIPDDVTISARVRTALLNEPNLSALQVEVDTNERVVTLTGTVRTMAERDRAIAIARDTGGVAAVRSELRVSP